MNNILLAGLGASVGSIIRYAITNYGKKFFKKRKNRYTDLPLPTLLINLTGAFILGFIFGIKVSPFIYTLVGTGILGGYTTFSTLNTELVGLFHNKNYYGLIWYASTSYLGGLILVFLGFYLGKLV